MTIRHPAAETFAKACPLPFTTCQETKELYGYAKPILDTKAATSLLNQAGFRCQTPAFDVALGIMQCRADSLR